MYRLISEWDIGEADTVFLSQGSVMTWLLDTPSVQFMAQNNNQEVDAFVRECFDNGLFVIRRLEIVD